MKILIIDDSPDFSGFLAHVLQGIGHQVFLAEDGASGLEAAQQHKPQVCFLDLQMPDMDGLQVLPKLLSLLPGTRVVLVTASATVESAVEAMKQGADDYIRKPLQIPDLKKLLQSLEARIAEDPSQLAISEQMAQATDQKAFEGKLKMERLLREHQWNKTEVAKVLGISRPTLNSRLKKLGIE
jgi:DNA-binding NtrC family response regulator